MEQNAGEGPGEFLGIAIGYGGMSRVGEELGSKVIESVGYNPNILTIYK